MDNFKKYGKTYSYMDEMMQTKDEQKMARVTEAFLKMKKFDIVKLEEASRG